MLVLLVGSTLIGTTDFYLDYRLGEQQITPSITYPLAVYHVPGDPGRVPRYFGQSLLAGVMCYVG
jgi:hypothetical protein